MVLPDNVMRILMYTMLSALPLMAASTPPTYICGRTDTPPVIDGCGNDAVWQNARELSPLKDIEGSDIPHQCRIKMLWDDEFLYLLADIDEPDLWATLQKHDSVIFHDPDFEVFIDPDGDGLNYIELEINQLNTTWDLFISRPYRFDDAHILHDWEMPELKHAVQLRGTINNPSDTDDGWSVELAVPWSSITSHAHQPRTSKAPQTGSCMRFNFSRVNWKVRPDADSSCGYTKISPQESNHVWAPTGKVNIHLPEHWGRVIFSKRNAAEWESTSPETSHSTRQALYRVLNEQLAKRNSNGGFTYQDALPTGVSYLYQDAQCFILQGICPDTGRKMKLDSEGRFSQTTDAYHLPELYLWVHGGAQRSEEEWMAQFTQYAQAGIDTVIIGDKVEQIAALTPLANKAGLRVIAWLWALNRPQDSIPLEHPDWFAVNALGKSCHLPENRPFVSYYQFLCPNHSEVRAHLLNQVQMLAKIPGISGIQADYMRMPDVELPRGLWEKYGLDMSRVLPEFDYCYCHTCREKFGNTPANGKEWDAFRLKSVADLYNDLAAEIRRHGLQAACAVFPSPGLAARLVRQDWSQFHADLVLPMTYHSFYNEAPEWIAQVTRAAASESGSRIPLAPGLHLPDFSASELLVQLQSLSETGVNGIALFSSDEITPAQLKAIRQWEKETKDEHVLMSH